MQPSRSQQRTVELHLEATCALRCPVCDCRDGGQSLDEMLDRLQGGGRRVTLRGAAADSPHFERVVTAARDAGFQEVIVRTNAVALADNEAAKRFAALGVDGVLVPFFSQHPAVHDKVAGRPEALVQALVGVRNLAKLGLDVDLEIPILPTRLQSLTGLVDLVHRAVPTMRGVKFVLVPRELPAAIAPPPWDEAAPELARAMERCGELGVDARLHTNNRVPLCALKDYPDLYTDYRFNPRRDSDAAGGCQYVDACDGCAVRGQCAGVALSYLRANGERGIRAWDTRPKRMYEQRTTPSRVWTEEQKAAASKCDLLVLRPTVNCNQDCPFCSANESSKNVWPDPDAMRKQIARAARRGIQRISFSGGEPTLSRHLPSFVRVASRCGIKRVELVSNGALLWRKRRVDELIEAGVTDAFISLHAHTELLSRMMTQKVGDFAKTVQAIHHLLDGGVQVVVNHVIGARNYRYLENYVEFIREEFGEHRVDVSFAFMTPQFKALMNMHLVPRLSDVSPYLRRALYRGLEIGVDCHIGSRQGIPPCMLGEFAAWSDILDMSAAAISEDQPQKQRGPGCDGCKYTRQCTGLWKPYVAVYGIDELEPIPGDPITDEEAAVLAHWPYSTGRPYPPSFDEVPPRLVNPNVTDYSPPELEAPPEPALDGFEIQRSRPLRIAMLGSGRQARRLAASAANVPRISIDAVASPHAPDGDLADFGNAPAYRDATEALDDIQPDAVIISAATHVHLNLAREAIERRIPILVEKPLTRTDDEADELLELINEHDGRVMVAHNVLYAPGLDQALALAPNPSAVSYRRRMPPMAPSAPRGWGREGLYQTLYHTMVLVGRAAGGGIPEVVTAQFTGDSTPERIRLSLRYGDTEADVLLDYRGREDELAVVLEDDAQTVTWSRVGHNFALDVSGEARDVERSGGEGERMLRAFAESVLDETDSPVPAQESADVMKTTTAVIEALEAAGAPTLRATAPKHVASKAMMHHPNVRRR